MEEEVHGLHVRSIEEEVHGLHVKGLWRKGSTASMLGRSGFAGLLTLDSGSADRT